MCPVLTVVTVGRDGRGTVGGQSGDSRGQSGQSGTVRFCQLLHQGDAGLLYGDHQRRGKDDKGSRGRQTVEHRDNTRGTVCVH